MVARYEAVFKAGDESVENLRDFDAEDRFGVVKRVTFSSMFSST